MSICYFETSSDGDQGFIQVGEALDRQEAADALKAAVNKHLETAKKVIVADLSQTKVINSYGIGRLSEMLKLVQNKGATFILRNVPEPYGELLKILRFDGLFSGEKKVPVIDPSK